MAISRVSSQQTGAAADNATSIACAYPVNVTNGNLLIISVAAYKPSLDAFVVGDISKTAGTATLGSFALDVSRNYQHITGKYINVAIFSVPVTGTGSCTITVGGAPAGSYLIMGIEEASGVDVSGTRLETSNSAEGSTGAPDSGNVTTAGAAIICGVLGTDTSSSTTHTPDAAFTQIYEQEDGSTHMTGGVIDRIVTTGTTDSASWTAPSATKWAAAVAAYKIASAGGTITVTVNQVTETDTAQPITRVRTTGQKYPTSGTSVAESPWLDDVWVTPTNIYSDNAATANITAATFDSGDQSYVLKATGFDFSGIPDGSTIVGVVCRINAWYRSGQGTGSIDLMQLLNTSASKVGTNQCSTPVALTTTNTTVITKGGATDLWGNSLTAAWVKNSNFGVALGAISTAANTDVDIDYVTLEVFYIPSLSATVNQVTETDTAQPITRRKIITVAQVTETDTAQPITRGSRTTTVSLGQVTETDTAQTIARQKSRTVAQISETDLAQAITRRKIRTVAQVTETNAAQSITRQKSRTVAQASETDTAQQITRLFTTITVAVGQVSETDAAQPITPRKVRTVGQVAETDTAQAITRRKIRTVAQVAETDTAQGITRRKIRTVAQISETDLAQTITRRKVKAVAQVTETDLAQAITRRKTKSVAQVTETDLAQSITRRVGYIVQPVEETDMAQALFPMKRLAIAQPIETDTALPIGVVKIAHLGQVVESDEAQPIVFGGRITVLVGQVLELDEAQPITRRRNPPKPIFPRSSPQRLDDWETLDGLTSHRKRNKPLGY